MQRSPADALRGFCFEGEIPLWGRSVVPAPAPPGKVRRKVRKCHFGGTVTEPSWEPVFVSQTTARLFTRRRGARRGGRLRPGCLPARLREPRSCWVAREGRLDPCSPGVSILTTLPVFSGDSASPSLAHSPRTWAVLRADCVSGPTVILLIITKNNAKKKVELF